MLYEVGAGAPRIGEVPMRVLCEDGSGASRIRGVRMVVVWSEGSGGIRIIRKLYMKARCVEGTGAFRMEEKRVGKVCGAGWARALKRKELVRTRLRWDRCTA